MVLRTLMSYENRFAQLTTESDENTAQQFLTQLSERLRFSKHQSKDDDEMECLQFGICSFRADPQRVIF